MKQQIGKRSSGFTIIEVLIVLAIAGLIMLIVFMAVPALQRNSRNTQRSSDAALIAAAVNECISNRNGQVNSCKELSGNAVNIDKTKLGQIEDATYTDGGGSVTVVNWFFGKKCSSDGLSVETGSNRQFVVRYLAETTGGTTQRCLDS
jgi:prepilin-type N-terminal cleavage/methylation domain-containing protein